MRTLAENGAISVQAIAGAYVVLLGIDMEASSRDVLGFAIERTDHNRNRTDWLHGFKSFRGANLPGGTLVSTHESDDLRSRPAKRRRSYLRTRPRMKLATTKFPAPACSGTE